MQIDRSSRDKITKFLIKKRFEKRLEFEMNI